MEYKDLVKLRTPKENIVNNIIASFIGGGVVGSISYFISLYAGTDIMLIFWILFSAILTGLGVFDDMVDKFKMGLIIPITGFAHSITSSMLDYKRDGIITGIGSNCFKLAGSVILYGVVINALLAMVRMCLNCI